MEQDVLRKRPPPQTSQPQNNKPHTGPPRQFKQQGKQPQRPTAPQSDDRPLCPECQRRHYGKCLAKENVCFKCKAPGHISTACPQLRQPTEGRVYVMQAEQANPDTTLIIGNPFLQHLIYD
ncbi:hypothetical protein F511_47442 [Dorcoceras hygrometricum]|uniref:CCHC-type domain-containing protein n=1 Tax=Dorcoceras hygrometricum TaxID=472368 RepID=A0A2Z6ZXG9_9LAMI|nr:hypothetical protein F511_47442 [Dorcoceras hygrometricum]